MSITPTTLQKFVLLVAATGFDPAQFQQAFNSVFLHAKTRDAFLELVTFDTPDCPELLADINAWIETEIQSVQQAYPDEKEHNKAS